MKKPNEIAEAILIVIKKFLKWILITIIAIVLFAAYFDYNNGKEYKKKQEREAKVTIVGYYKEPNGCDVGYPYLYEVRNTSDKTVVKTDFTVEIRKKGFSSALNRYTSIDEDKILKPGEGYARCFRAQNKDFSGDVKEKDVDIIVEYKNITFLN